MADEALPDVQLPLLKCMDFPYYFVVPMANLMLLAFDTFSY